MRDVSGESGATAYLWQASTALPVSVRTALTKLGTDGLVVLGGPNAVSPAVEAGL